MIATLLIGNSHSYMAVCNYPGNRWHWTMSIHEVYGLMLRWKAVIYMLLSSCSYYCWISKALISTECLWTRSNTFITELKLTQTESIVSSSAVGEIFAGFQLLQFGKARANLIIHNHIKIYLFLLSVTPILWDFLYLESINW
jgi:hypothetical protein